MAWPSVAGSGYEETLKSIPRRRNTAIGESLATIQLKRLSGTAERQKRHEAPGYTGWPSMAESWPPSAGERKAGFGCLRLRPIALKALFSLRPRPPEAHLRSWLRHRRLLFYEAQAKFFYGINLISYNTTDSDSHYSLKLKRRPIQYMWLAWEMTTWLTWLQCGLCLCVLRLYQTVCICVMHLYIERNLCCSQRNGSETW